MSGIQLTYDSRQDRILLCSGMEIAMPTWWMTRRETRKLLKSISAVTTSQYEIEKMIEQFSASAKVGEDAITSHISDKSAKSQSYRDFHQSHAGGGAPEVNLSTDVETTPEQYPLAVKINMDLSDHQGIKLFLLNELRRGICLEFSQEGLYKFNNMLFTVSQRAQWI